MDNIEKLYMNADFKNIFENRNEFNVFKAGYKSANPLPTEGVCPECNGMGYWEIKGNLTRKCRKCKNGKIPLYYTPEDYLRIMGVPYPDDCMVWAPAYGYGVVIPYKHAKMDKRTKRYYIVQTAQPAPGADYRSKV